MNKVIGAALILFATWVATRDLEPLQKLLRSPAQSLHAQIEDDILAEMKSAGLPASNGIHHVHLRFRSPLAHELLSQDKILFETTKAGKIWLEIEVIDLPDDKKPGFITQTSAFDLKTNNKIAEFGKTYWFNNQASKKVKSRQ